MLGLISLLGHIGRAGYHYQRICKDVRDISHGQFGKLIVRHIKGKLHHLLK